MELIHLKLRSRATIRVESERNFPGPQYQVTQVWFISHDSFFNNFVLFKYKLTVLVHRGLTKS